MTQMEENLQSDKDWHIVITPDRKFLSINLQEIFEYRALIKLFVVRNFKASYKQTLLGPWWHVINPIISSVVFTLVFKGIANISTDGIPAFLFYLLGNVIWNFFSGCLIDTSNVFVRNLNIYEKVYFPRLIMPLATVATNLINFLIRFIIFSLVLGYYLLNGFKISFNYWILLSPFFLLITAGIGMGTGIIISSMTIKYKDLQALVKFGVQFLMFLSPVIYPVSEVPERFRLLYLANPIAPIFEAFRYTFLGARSIEVGGLLYSFFAMVIILLFGVFLFNKVEKNFLDTI